MAALHLNELQLHICAPETVIEHLQETRLKYSENDISVHLLKSIEKNSLPPSIFVLWFRLSPTPATIRLALSQHFSAPVRRAAIKVFWKNLASKKPKWRETWEGIGGTQGFIDILNSASVSEVKHICRVISWSTKLTDPPEKRELFTEVFKALFSQEYFKNSEYQNTDQRRLEKHYKLISPACTSEFISEMANSKHAPDCDWKGIQHKMIVTIYADYLEFLRLQADLKEFPHAQDWINLYSEIFPRIEDTDHGISPSLRFPLEAIQKSQKGSWQSIIRQTFPIEYIKKPEFFVEGIIFPLAHRICKAPFNAENGSRILDLALQFFEENPKQTKSLAKKPGDLVDLAILLWSTKAGTDEKPDPEVENRLRKVLKLYYSSKKPEEDDAQNWRYFARLVDQSLSYLLRLVERNKCYTLFLFCLESVGIDLKRFETMEPLKNPQLELGYSFLSLFEPAQALYLFELFRRVCNGTDFIKEQKSTLLSQKALDQNFVDPDLWQIFLLQRNARRADAEELALKCFTARKEKAVKGTTPQLRATLAYSAIMYTIASGSAKLYGVALDWIAQRFIRDSFVASTIYRTYISEAKLLMVGIPDAFDSNEYNLERLMEAMKEAHDLIANLYDTAFVAVKEPAFNISVWTETLSIISSVIQDRLKATCTLKSRYKLSDDEEYSLLWKDLISLIINIEKKGLQPGFERLNLNTTKGIFRYGSQNRQDLTLKPRTSATTYKFFDNLAEARDKLWQDFRAATHPSIPPSPFPQGLPIQCLLGGYIKYFKNPDLEADLPYIFTRARKAVFLLPDSYTKDILPGDDKLWASIGRFVDDYGTAIRLLVPEDLTYSERTSRLDPILSHLIETLGPGRLNKIETVVYWQHWLPVHLCPNRWERGVWQDRIYDLLNKKNLDNWPTLPNNEGETGEWNPQEGFICESRDLEHLTYLDLTLKVSEISPDNSSVTVHSMLERFTPRMLAQDGIWSDSRVARAIRSPAMREGQILSALLYLQNHFSVPGSMLESTLSRYNPSIQLKPDVYSTTTANFNAAIKTLRRHVNSVPPQILSNIISSILKNDTSDSKIDISFVIHLLKLLESSSTPSLTSPFSSHIIIHHPDSSSWHRQLLHPTILASLPAKDAIDSITTFSNSLAQYLKSKPGSIKITTIKLLASLLERTDIFPAPLIISTLSSISTLSTHIDVRKTVLDSLLSILKSTHDSEIASQAIQALTFIIPVAGNLNEYAPLTSLHWEEASEKKVLPELNMSSSILLQTLVSTLYTPHSKFLYKREFISSILLPTIEYLKSETWNYISLFLTLQSLSTSEISDLKGILPIVPRTYTTFKDILHNEPHLFPRGVLEEYAKYMIYKISTPPKVVEELNKKFKKDKKDKKVLDESVEWWLRNYGNDIEYGLPGNLSTLREKMVQLPKVGVDKEVVRKEVMNVLVGNLFLGIR